VGGAECTEDLVGKAGESVEPVTSEARCAPRPHDWLVLQVHGRDARLARHAIALGQDYIAALARNLLRLEPGEVVREPDEGHVTVSLTQAGRLAAPVEPLWCPRFESAWVAQRVKTVKDKHRLTIKAVLDDAENLERLELDDEPRDVANAVRE
jgi:hypothetical protein